MTEREGKFLSGIPLLSLTSNLASDTIIEMCSGTQDITDKEIVEAIRPRLSAHFQPALLARCRIVPFRPLSEEVLRGVVGLKLDKIAQRLKETYGIQLICSPELLDRIAMNCTCNGIGRPERGCCH